MVTIPVARGASVVHGVLPLPSNYTRKAFFGVKLEKFRFDETGQVEEGFNMSNFVVWVRNQFFAADNQDLVLWKVSEPFLQVTRVKANPDR